MNNILISVDIEDECRLALKDYLTVYVRPLPESFATPSTLIECVGGSSENEIDSFNVKLSTRATTDADALETLQLAVGILEERAKEQFGELRSVRTNSLASWGSDPIRPDLKLATATLSVVAHRKSLEIES